MFKPIDTPFTTHSYKAPEAWDGVHGECEPLPVNLVGYEGYGKFTSWWRVSFMDRIRILFGRPVRLIILSNYHPAVCVDCEKDNK